MTWRIIEEGEIPSLPLGRIKSAFRIQHDFDDDLLRHLIQVSKQYIETYTQQILGDVKLELTIDRWDRSKHPWSGLIGENSTPVVWIPLPIGPLKTLETVSLRNKTGEWTDVSPEQFIVAGQRLGIRADWPLVASGIHSIRLVGRAGLAPIPVLIEGIWLNIVRCLYDSETPDMSIVHAALQPLNAMKPKTLV